VVRLIDRSGVYPPTEDLTGESSWTDGLGTWELADVLRSTMREEYADASDEEMSDALETVLEAMSPAEALNFGSALNQIGKSATRLASDPTFIQAVRTAAPIAGGALGTVIGGPVGTALGSKLGSLAANALPTGAPPPSAAAVAAPPAAAVAVPGIPAPATAQPVAATPVPSTTAMPSAELPPPAPGPASSVAGGSDAAAQALVLALHPDVLRSLLATALGQHGRQRVSGVPAAQVITLFSQVLGQAAADADELMYLGQQADAPESLPEEASADSAWSLYSDLLGADNLELAEAVEWEGLDA
jgi:hypothetical protein